MQLEDRFVGRSQRGRSARRFRDSLRDRWFAGASRSGCAAALESEWEVMCNIFDRDSSDMRSL